MRKLFERKARSAGCTEGNSGFELVELIFQLFQLCQESRKTLPFLGHDRCRSAFDEIRIGELDIGLCDLPFEASDFLLQARALGGDIHLDIQHELCRAHRSNWRVHFWELVCSFDALDACKLHEGFESKDVCVRKSRNNDLNAD